MENKIKTARQRAGLTQQELAEKIGLSQKHISRWELEKFNPKINNLKKIADALQCDITDLI